LATIGGKIGFSISGWAMEEPSRTPVRTFSTPSSTTMLSDAWAVISGALIMSTPAAGPAL
jgi:hypothetical protein